jgi:hypothetical protein
MGSDPELFRRLGKVATWTTAIFGVALAAAAFVQGSLVSKSTPILGVLAAVSAIIQLLCEKRASTLEERRKLTPPAMTVKAVLESPTLVKLAIISDNLIPFECQWLICTAGNQVVGPVPLEWTKILPSKGRRLFLADDHIQPNKVRDGHLEIRFSFRSPYATEVGATAGLHGSMVVPVHRPPSETA